MGSACMKPLVGGNKREPVQVNSRQRTTDTQDFLQVKFEQQDLTMARMRANRVLVLGMGGGCDVFSAYTLAKKLNGGFDVGRDRRKEGAGGVLYANCVSERKAWLVEEGGGGGEPPSGGGGGGSGGSGGGGVGAKKRKVPPEGFLTLVPDALYAVPRGPPRPLQAGENTYGNTRLEESVPRGAGDSPLLFEVLDHKHVATREDVAALTAENVRRLHAAWDHLGVDLIFAVDTGGDSLTGGKDFNVDPITGRDMQMIHALRLYEQIHRGNFRFIHIVLGPGCDAETEEDTMREEITREDWTGHKLPQLKGRNYLGSFQVEDMITDTFEMVKVLKPNRTPFLMYRALRNDEEFHLDRPGEGEGEGAAAAAAGTGPAGRDLVRLERHGNAAVVPRAWLLHGLAFDYAPLPGLPGEGEGEGEGPGGGGA